MIFSNSLNHRLKMGAVPKSRSRVSKKGAGLKSSVTVPVAIVNDTQTHYENQ